jgi:hypothetical protein
MASGKKNRKKHKSRGRKVSAVNFNNKDARAVSRRLTAGEYQPALSGDAAEIKRLISKGKNKAAVSRAKKYHKSLGTQESERILVDAYLARIHEMVTKDFRVEAKALLELVGGRYNCPDHRLAELNAVMFAREGRIDELVHPLIDPGIKKEKRGAIEKVIKNEVVDINLLARCDVLPSDHSLKTGALDAAKAFAEVTTGFVDDGQIALPGVSRRSPLAPWKMLIKALACFYRYDDEICEKYLQAVDPESAPARLVPLIRQMTAGKANGNVSGCSALLIEKVVGNSQKMQKTLQKLDSALAGKKPQKLFKAARNAVNICEQSCPELIDRLKQHISIRSWMIDVDAEDVNRAMGGPSFKNAYFWRLHARAAEKKGIYLWACALWEEFRKHALHEGWFSDDSQAVSVIYLHMADLLQKLPAEDLDWQRSNFERTFRGFESYYHQQPRAVLEAVRKDTSGAFGTYFLYPEHLYRMASKIDSASETFRQWLEWSENHNSHWKKSDAVANAWHAAVPDDTRPLLSLMQSAEKRNALKKALGYLEKAERLDGLNPDVKRARLRLLAATAIRHLKQKKTHLAQKDFTEIEVLPQSGEGDRPAFLVALKAVCEMIDRKDDESSRLTDELYKRLGNKLTAKMVMEGLLTACGFSDPLTGFPSDAKEPLTGDDLVAAVASGCKLGDDMGIPVTIPRECEEKISDCFTTEVCTLDSATIRIIAQAALRNENLKLAYAAAGAGLSQGGAATARFLLLRARSLPAWEMTRRDDCITAAIELARRERDMDLIDEAIEWRRDGRGSPFGFSIWNNMRGESNFSLETDELNDVLLREKEARDYPSSRSLNFLNDYDDEDDDLEDSRCKYCDVRNCPDRDAAFRPVESYDDGFDDDDDDDDFDHFLDFDDALDNSLPVLPPELESLLMEALLKHGSKNGSLPDPDEFAQKDPELAAKILLKVLDAKADGSLPDLGRDLSSANGRRSRRSRRKR